MPELPEVEHVRRSLLSSLLERKIIQVIVRQAGQIHRPLRDAETFQKALIGRQFISIERRGKYLVFHLDGNHWLVCHLRMTGKLLIKSSQEGFDKHTHLIFKLDDGNQLFYHDVRRFGGMSLWFNDPFMEKPLYSLGIEPLNDSFDESYLKKIFKNRKLPIKAALLNQEMIAGIGNIYADEILFRAGIRPRKSVHRLKRQERQAIVSATKEILNAAILAGGSSIRDYQDSMGRTGAFQQQHQVYGRGGQQCMNCGNQLKKIIVAGRASVYCPICQKS